MFNTLLCDIAKAFDRTESKDNLTWDQVAKIAMWTTYLDVVDWKWSWNWYLHGFLKHSSFVRKINNIILYVCYIMFVWNIGGLIGNMSFSI